MGSGRSAGGGREHRITSVGSGEELHCRLHAGLFNGKLHVLGGCIRA